jgi:hypothetical protein
MLRFPLSTGRHRNSGHKAPLIPATWRFDRRCAFAWLGHCVRIRGPPNRRQQGKPKLQTNRSLKVPGESQGTRGILEMELRQLVSDHERQVFAKCLGEARATRGFGFRETSRSALGKAHIQFGSLYALFDDEGGAAEQMVGGFISHNLATLPQSYPRPDVSHLPPRYVIEGGELWSLSRGAGRVAHHVAAAVVGLLQAKAVIVYPIIEPVDLTTEHLRLGFAAASERVKFPYGETIDGREIWVQPLILEGERLEDYIGAGFEFLFHANPGERPMLRFDRSTAAQGPQRATASSVGNGAETAPTVSLAARSGEEHNGASAQ